MAASLTQSSNNKMAESNKEIGDLLIQVQDELKSLRTLIARDGSNVDMKLLQTNLKKAEDDIKQKSDLIINQLNSQVKMLPMLEDVNDDEVDGEMLPTSDYAAPVQNLWDLAKRNKRPAITMGERGTTSSSARGPARSGTRSIAEFANNQIVAIQTFQKEKEQMSNNNNMSSMLVDSQEHFVEEMQEISSSSKRTATANGAAAVNPFNLTPGQQVKVGRETRMLFNPENVLNRNALNENYGLQLPLIEKKEKLKMSTHIITGSTVEHLSTLPLVYRRNPTLIPPPVDPNESKHGILSLIERGLIPPTAKITFDQFPIKNRPSEEKSLENDQTENVPRFKNNELVYKLDLNYDPNKTAAVNKENTNPNGDDQKLVDKKTKNGPANNTNNKLKPVRKSTIRRKNTSMNPNDSIDQPLRPPATPLNTLQLELYDSSKFVHKFVIQNGRVRTDLADYASFKQSYILRWGSVSVIIKNLEDLCYNYSVPFGIADGSKVAELSRCIDMDIKPNQDELIETFLNKEEVEKIVKRPGQMFRRKDGEYLAAVKIQSTWRRFKLRREYLQYRKRKWAAGVIALTWVTYVKISKAREKLKLSRLRELETFRKRQKEFIRNWPKIKESRRVIIHLPSFGYSETIRNSMRDLAIKQNYQITRICDIFDKNVDVIYVSPIELNEETLQYYSKLFALRAAVESGNPKDYVDVSTRYKIVVPEALNKFPSHQMALSTVLKYSPQALERIKNLIKGRDAYIVPGFMNVDDIHIADILNVPILGCEPELASLYSSKSGSKRIFQSAKVFTPYGEFDIYNKEQLYECLAQAITENLIVQRWLLKLDDEFDGRGIAYCDIGKHMSCYNAALKEMIKFGDKWGKRWAYEPTYVKILEEIPDVLNKFAKPANTDAYPTWDAYLKAFLARGGVLEAHPPSDSVTSLTVSMLIEPDSIRIVSSGDHIHAGSAYSCWGITFPQTSVEPRILNETCMRVADACRQRSIMGYVDIDFVTFIDPKTDEQVLWATDMNISYSEHVATSSLLYYLSNGVFNQDEHSYEVPASTPVVAEKLDPKARRKSRKPPETNSRYAIMSSRLNHSNLAVIHYSVFFQTCRALGIGYDLKERQGTIFTLIDSLNHVNMGMLTLTDNLQTAMQQFATNLAALHREISTEHMQGRGNFIVASNNIKEILDSSNVDEQQQKETSTTTTTN